MKYLPKVVRMSRNALVAKSQAGVTMIEYALMAALIAVILIAVVTNVGTNLSKVFQSIATSV